MTSLGNICLTSLGQVTRATALAMAHGFVLRLMHALQFLVLGKRLQLPLALQRLAVAFAVFDCGTVSLREMARQATPPQVR